MRQTILTATCTLLAACDSGGLEISGWDSGAGGGSDAVAVASGGAGGNGGADASGGGAPGTGGAPADLPPCASLVPAPALEACVTPVGGWTDGAFAAPRNVQVSGTITSVVYGPFPAGCLSTQARTSGEAVTLTVRGEQGGLSGDWDVEYLLPRNGVTWTPGKHLNVTYTQSGGGFSPVISTLLLNTGQAVDIYVGQGGPVSSLGKVPLTFRQGPAICIARPECGNWSNFDLEVLNNDGWTAVPYASTVRIGAYRVIHGGDAQQTSSGACADWFVSNAHVAVIRDGQ